MTPQLSHSRDHGMDSLLRERPPMRSRLTPFPAVEPNLRRPRMAVVTTIPDAQWQFMRGQNQFLDSEGFELHGIASPGELLPSLAQRDQIPVYAIPMSREIRPFADLVALVRLVRTLRRIRPDILHLSTPKAALLGSIAGWLTGVPIRLFLVRGLISDGAVGLRKRLLRAAESLTMRLCHVACFTSPSLLRFAEDEGMVRADRGVVLRDGMSNGIDVAHFNPDRVRAVNLRPSIPLRGRSTSVIGPVIGFVGRLGRDKGLDLLWQAWQRLRIEFPHARLLIVGGWERERPVDPHTRRSLEDDPRVILAGRVDDVAPYYRAMHVFAFPSRREGFPNAPMEASAMGVPVVATDAVGSRDAVLDDVTGRLTPPGDAAAFAQAVAVYLRDPQLARRHGAAGRRRVQQHFQQRPIWQAMRDELIRLLAERGLPLPRPAATADEQRRKAA